MSDAMEFAPEDRMRKLRSKDSEMMRLTAMASPRARPRPSMTAPTRPPLPKGRTTSRMTRARLAPSARAASRSGRGVREKISRQMEVTMGSTMMDTRTPAMNEEPVKTVVPGATLKMGMKLTWSEIHRERPTM